MIRITVSAGCRRASRSLSYIKLRNGRFNKVKEAFGMLLVEFAERELLGRRRVNDIGDIESIVAIFTDLLLFVEINSRAIFVSCGQFCLNV